MTRGGWGRAGLPRGRGAYVSRVTCTHVGLRALVSNYVHNRNGVGVRLRAGLIGFGSSTNRRGLSLRLITWVPRLLRCRHCNSTYTGLT